MLDAHGFTSKAPRKKEKTRHSLNMLHSLPPGHNCVLRATSSVAAALHEVRKRLLETGVHGGGCITHPDILAVTRHGPSKGLHIHRESLDQLKRGPKKMSFLEIFFSFLHTQHKKNNKSWRTKSNFFHSCMIIPGRPSMLSCLLACLKTFPFSPSPAPRIPFLGKVSTGKKKEKIV